MAECFWPGVSEGQVVEAGARAWRAAEAASGDGAVARYLGSILVPADEIALCLFEATSLETAQDLNRRAGIPSERVIEIVRLHASCGGFRHRSCAMTTTFARSTAITAIGLLAALACAVSPPQSQARTTGECSGVVKGAPWSYKGQKGTTYMVVGVNGVSCAVGLKFMPKWTRTRGAYDLKPVPAGWHCSAVGDYTHLAKVGQCTTTKGGIFEWLPKTKK